MLAQIAGAVVGHGMLFYLAMGSLFAILALSANTSFVAFPRLCHSVAADGYLPKSFAIAGHRLVYTVGILYVTVMAALLLIVFRGVTDRLIPLFAIGAFLTFTLSQLGMVFHWRRERGGYSSVHLWINLTGAAVTGGALIVIVLAKFVAGAWITLLVIPLVIWMLRSIHRYYRRLEPRVEDAQPLAIAQAHPPVVLLVFDVTELADPGSDEHVRQLQDRWEQNVARPARAAAVPVPELRVEQASRRALHEPVLACVKSLRKRYGEGRRIAVLIPEIARQHWYQHLLHTRRSARLKSCLMLHGGPSVIVIAIPWYLDHVT